MLNTVKKIGSIAVIIAISFGFKMFKVYISNADERRERLEREESWRKTDEHREMLRENSEQGDRDAQFELGNEYSLQARAIRTVAGLYNKPDTAKAGEYEEQAVYWWRKAEEQGHAHAQRNLGYRYFTGEGVVQDYGQAVFWLLKSAEQGNITALKDLELCHDAGITANYAQVVDWWRRAAEQGSEFAQHGLGVCYYGGKGITKDYVQAVYWWQKAAEQQYAYAEYSLAVCYENGHGLARDGNMALHLYEKSIKNIKNGNFLSEKVKIDADNRISALKEKGYSSTRVKIQ